MIIQCLYKAFTWLFTHNCVGHARLPTPSLMMMRQPTGRRSETWQCGARTTILPSMWTRQKELIVHYRKQKAEHLPHPHRRERGHELQSSSVSTSLRNYHGPTHTNTVVVVNNNNSATSPSGGEKKDSAWGPTKPRGQMSRDPDRLHHHLV
jgi:hypothetical protein